MGAPDNYYNHMRKAIKADKQLVSEILVSAFSPLKESNSVNLIVKQDEKRIERMHILMEYLFEKAFSFGAIFISDNNSACLLLKFPHREKITLKSIWQDLKLVYGCIGIKRVFGILKRQRIARQNYPKENHIRPIIMGVKDESKGKGTAARLMIAVKNEFKNTTLPVIIDAASENNTYLYQKFGFKIIKKEESLGFPIYFLRLN